MSTFKEQALTFLGVKRWHEAGYAGEGTKIMSGEKVCQKQHGDVISPKGFNSKKGHGDSVMAHIKLIAPNAELIAYPFSGTFSSSAYKCDCVDYIMKNKVNVFTTSKLGASVDKGKDKAMQDCIDNGCVFFAAAGNDGDIKQGETSSIHGESASEKYFAIGGVKPTFLERYYQGEPVYDWGKLKRVTYSSEGAELDYVTIAEILGASGTSFCSPVFAGMVALVQQFFIEKVGRPLTRSEMEIFINDNLVDLDEEGFDIRTGYGLFKLPDPDDIAVLEYVTSENFGEHIDYSGFPEIGGDNMEIKQMFLTPSEYTRPQFKIIPSAIAWHYVGNPGTSALANRNYFENLKDTRATKASCHYIIGLEGEILQLIPDDEISYCTNQANRYTISVECCHPDSTGKFTEATYQSMVWLGRYLMKKHGIKENIRHYDVTGKCCPKWFVDNPNEWHKFKSELEEEEDMKRYKTVEEMPDYAQKPIQELIDKGILKGKGGDLGLDLSEDMIRVLMLAEKIFEQGA